MWFRKMWGRDKIVRGWDKTEAQSLARETVQKKGPAFRQGPCRKQPRRAGSPLGLCP